MTPETALVILAVGPFILAGVIGASLRIWLWVADSESRNRFREQNAIINNRAAVRRAANREGERP